MPGYATEEQGHRTRIGRSRPNIVIFWPFLAFKSRLGGLKDPLEVRVEVETCRTIDGTHLECILSRKNWTGSAGGVRNGQNRSESDSWPIPWKIQGLDKTQAILETRRNTFNVKGRARSPWSNGRFDT